MHTVLRVSEELIYKDLMVSPENLLGDQREPRRVPRNLNLRSLRDLSLKVPRNLKDLRDLRSPDLRVLRSLRDPRSLNLRLLNLREAEDPRDKLEI